MTTHSNRLIGNLPILISLFLSALLSCAHAQPSEELLKARAAYSNAESGPATALDPADLHEARVALDSAEEAAGSDPQSFDARQRAYLALRRAELADAQGKTAAAMRDRDLDAAQELVLKDQLLAAAQSRLAASREQNQKVKGALEATQDKLATANQQQLASDEKFQTEHDARMAAEKRAFDALEKLGAVKTDARGLVLTLSGSVIFASNKSVLLPSAQRRIGDLADALRDSPRSIRVEGHTDSRGSVETNQLLSQRRAEAVMAELIFRNVPEARITAIGLGATRPVADNATAEGRANNRRVEVILLREPEPQATNQ
jgi:outer membrane protein OmpA-like peptidoglycan-associated protein